MKIEEGMEGWKPIIVSVIKLLAVRNAKPTQIKEKFGALRIYTDISSEHINTILLTAEAISSVTCQRCGCYSKIRERKGWYTTTCDKCL